MPAVLQVAGGGEVEAKVRRSEDGVGQRVRRTGGSDPGYEKGVDGEVAEAVGWGSGGRKSRRGKIA